MKIHYTLLLSCCLCLWCYFGNAQLYTHAGLSRAICRGDSVILGGTDTATNATAPFSYHWQPATGLSATDVPQPMARPAVTTTYYLTSSDANGVVSVDSVTIIVKFSDTYITASDTLVCPGQQIQLSANLSSPVCAATASCIGNNVSQPLGTDSIVQPGTSLQGPSLFGNFYRSSRSQMLYTRAELQAVLGGPAVIKVLTFSNGEFNSSAFLQNFTIKMGCAFQDSLTNWNDNLKIVFSANNYTPGALWMNSIPLRDPFYWDGYSDILIDICNYNPNTFGSMGNKAECTPTAFKSYLYSTGNTYQCGGGTTPTAYYLRPNVKFNYCVPATPPVWLPVSNYEWGADNGISIANPLSFLSMADVSYPGYCYFTVSDSTCAWRDSVFINTKSSTTILPDNRFCPDLSNGSAVCVVNRYSDTISYWLSSAGLNDTLLSGRAVNGDSLHFSGLDTGRYVLHVYDSICTYATFSFILDGYPAVVLGQAYNYQAAGCNGGNNGGFCVEFAGGAPPYLFRWDTISTQSECNYSLTAGLHQIQVTDGNGCLSQIRVFSVPDSDNATAIASVTDFVKCYGEATGRACVSLSTGTSPYIYVWDSLYTGSICNDTLRAGTHFVIVRDALGCESKSNIFTIYQPGGPLTVNSSIDSNTLYMNVTSGTIPYTVYWGDGTTTSMITSGTRQHTYANDGVYEVVVSDMYGCEYTMTVTIVGTGIVRADDGESFVVHPNPAHSVLYLSATKTAITNITLYDAMGRYLTVSRLPTGNAIDISGLVNGVYVVVIETLSGSFTRRFVKE